LALADGIIEILERSGRFLVGVDLSLRCQHPSLIAWSDRAEVPQAAAFVKRQNDELCKHAGFQAKGGAGWWR
jgi:hypothetical protein